MNRQNKNGISWTEYTWNPVTGCKHGCSYCYAKRISMRFQGHFDPMFHENRLRDPYKIKEPSKIFVCSMADLFGDWVEKRWIKKVIQVARNNPRHVFQFLTKNPKRYSEFKFPKNCWLGVTLTGENTESDYDKIVEMVALRNYKFVSIEPLLGEIKNLLAPFDLVIVGAMTGPGSIEPKKEWIDSIKHNNIFYKENIKRFLIK